MSILVTPDMLIAAKAMHDFIVAHQEKVRGTQVRLLVGKYAGREAVITEVAFDPFRRSERAWTYCCMVARHDGSDRHLNTDGESRSYRPPSEFEIIGEKP